MDFKAFLEKTVRVLEKEGVRYAAAGGLVATLYRVEERLTKDLDFLFLCESRVEQRAAQIIRSVDLIPHEVRKANLEGGPLFAIKRKNTPVWIVVGRGNDTMPGLDLILPGIPWFEKALPRAEKNRIDFKFAKIPCLTIEDMIISKLFSFQNDQSRRKDLDDLESIFLAHHPLELPYLGGQMKKLGLKIPKAIKTVVPKALNLISRSY